MLLIFFECVIILQVHYPYFSILSIDQQPITFYLCNCHLFWDPKYSDVKLVQAYQLLIQIQLLMQQETLPLIICGDFNSEPHSAVYILLIHSMILLDMNFYLQDMFFLLIKMLQMTLRTL